jgi:hypothetical protein
MSTITDEEYDRLMRSSADVTTADIIGRLSNNTRVKKSSPPLVDITRAMYTLDETRKSFFMNRLNQAVDLAEAATNVGGTASDSKVKELCRARLYQATAIASLLGCRIHRDWQNLIPVPDGETAHRRRREVDPTYINYQNEEETWRLAGTRAEHGYIYATVIRLAQAALQGQIRGFPYWTPERDQTAVPWYHNVDSGRQRYKPRFIDTSTRGELEFLSRLAGPVSRGDINALSKSAAIDTACPGDPSATKRSDLYDVQYTDNKSLDLCAAMLELAGRTDRGARIPLLFLSTAIKYDSNSPEQNGDMMRTLLHLADGSHPQTGEKDTEGHAAPAADWLARTLYAIGVLTESGETIKDWQHTQPTETASSAVAVPRGSQGRARSRPRSRTRGGEGGDNTERRPRVRPSRRGKSPRAILLAQEAQRAQVEETARERLTAAILTQSIKLIVSEYMQCGLYCDACVEEPCKAHWWDDPEEIDRIPGRHLLPGNQADTRTQERQGDGKPGT